MICLINLNLSNSTPFKIKLYVNGIRVVNILKTKTMKIFTIIVFGYAVIRAFAPLLKRDFFHDTDFKIMFNLFKMGATLWAYVWFLNLIWEYEEV